MLQKPAPEIGTIGLNSTPDSGTSVSCQCTTSNVIDCLLATREIEENTVDNDFFIAISLGTISRHLRDLVTAAKNTEVVNNRNSLQFLTSLPI